MGERPRGDKRCPKCGAGPTCIQGDSERGVGRIYICLRCGFSAGFNPNPFYEASKRYYAKPSPEIEKP